MFAFAVSNIIAVITLIGLAVKAADVIRALSDAGKANDSSVSAGSDFAGRFFIIVLFSAIFASRSAAVANVNNPNLA